MNSNTAYTSERVTSNTVSVWLPGLSAGVVKSYATPIHIYIYSHIPAEYILTQWIRWATQFLEKYVPLNLFASVGVWEGVDDRTELQHIDPPLLWPSALCLSRSPGLLNRRPGGPPCWLSFPHPLTNSSDLQLNRESRGPLLRGGGFPYHTLSSARLNSNSLTSCTHRVI